MGCNETLKTILCHILGLLAFINGLAGLVAGLVLLSVVGDEESWGKPVALTLVIIGSLLVVLFVAYTCNVIRQEWNLFGVFALPLSMRPLESSWDRQEDTETPTTGSATPEGSLEEYYGPALDLENFESSSQRVS